MAGYPIRADGSGASSSLERGPPFDARVARGFRDEGGAAGLAAEDVANSGMLALKPEIMRLLGIDFHLADRIDLVDGLGFVRHRAPPLKRKRRVTERDVPALCRAVILRYRCRVSKGQSPFDLSSAP